MMFVVEAWRFHGNEAIHGIGPGRATLQPELRVEQTYSIKLFSMANASYFETSNPECDRKFSTLTAVFL